MRSRAKIRTKLAHIFCGVCAPIPSRDFSVQKMDNVESNVGIFTLDSDESRLLFSRRRKTSYNTKQKLKR